MVLQLADRRKCRLHLGGKPRGAVRELRDPLGGRHHERQLRRFIVQARTVSATDKGFVFLNSRLTHGPGPGPAAGDVPTGSRAATYLARSPGTSTTNDNVAYINCQMDTHIIPRGWAFNTAGQPTPNPAVATAASGWREFGTKTLAGAAVNLATRIGGHLLTASEVAAGFSSRAQIFAAFGGGAGWNPQP